MPGEIRRKIRAEMKALKEFAQRGAPKGDVSMRPLRERTRRNKVTSENVLAEACL